MTSRKPTATSAADPGLPEGVVTFLFSDIEGSTRLLEQHRAAFGPVLARHHDLLEDAIRIHHGVVFEAVGDAVYGAFERPSEAVAAAVEIQRRMRDEPWRVDEPIRVRIALHSGAVETRGSHYFGPALFEAARMQSLAHGGQTIASSTTTALVGRDLPAGIALRELGAFRLADLEEPVEIAQVDGDGLLTQFPPLRSSVRSPSNLPHDTSSFVGRVDDLARLDALIREQRLVSLIGTGGTGKTRLAIEAASRQRERFRDGVWLVELSPVSDAGLVLTQIADTWGLRPGHNSPLEDVLRRYLVDRELLLVVDNCEHVLEAAAGTIHDVLRHAPRVSVVSTSRESLGLPGEVEYRVGALAVESDGVPAIESDAVRLFLDRLHSTRPDAEVSAADLEAIERVCRRVEGIPLGIELAAARSRVLTPVELADRLETTFQALGAAPKSSEPRQRTLQATLDWSHDLLDQRQQRLFRRLAYFAGSFDVSAVEAVCGTSAMGVDALEGLESLVDRSLVTTVPGPATRFRLLEPVREYALGHLLAAGERPEIASAHARHFADFVATAAPHTRTTDQMPWERRLDADYDNIRVALETLLERRHIETYLGVAFDLFHYWTHMGMQVEGVASIVAGLEEADSTTDAAKRLRAWFAGALLLAEITDPAGIDLARRGLDLAESIGEPSAIGRLELALGAAIRHATNDPEYLPHLQRARQLLDADPEPHWWEPQWERAYIDLLLASYLPPEDELKEAHVRSAIDAFADIGDDVMHAHALFESAMLLGHADEAWLMDNLYRSVEMLDGLQAAYQHGHALMILGILLGLRGENGAAAPQLAEASEKLMQMGDVSCWAQANRALCQAQVDLDSAEDAVAPLVEVIEAMPQLPMPEYDLPKSLDAAVRVLLALGRRETAAYTLGRARATPFEVTTLLPRDTLSAEEQRLEAELGRTELDRLLAEGADADDGAALARIVKELRTA